MAKLTKQQVQKIADLARIKLTKDELAKFATQISEILEYVEQLEEVDVSDVQRASHVADFKGKVLEEDNSQQGLSNKQVLMNDDGGKADNGYFKIQQIVKKN